MIAASAPDTIRIAMAKVGFTTTFELLPHGDSAIPEKQRTKHPTKSFYRFATPVVDSVVRNKLQQELGAMVVCQDGILVQLDPLPSAAAPVDPSTPAIALPQGSEVAQPETTTETSVAEPTGVTGNALPKIEVDHSETSVTHTSAVKDAEPVRPVKTSDIKVSITPTELDKLLNDIAVTILYMWGSGSAFNVAYYRVQS